MIRKFIPLKNQIQNSFISSSIRHSFSTIYEEDMNIKMNLYFSEQNVKQFIVKQNTTFEELEQLLKNEDEKIKTVKYSFNGEVLTDRDTNFVDFALNNHLDILINNRNHAFDIDLEGNAAYYNNSKYDAYFARNEIPIQDAELLGNYMNIYNKTLQQKYPGTTQFSVQQIQECAFEALQNFAEKNNPVNVQKKIEILNGLVEQLENEKQNLRNLEQQAETKSKNYIRNIMILNVMMGGVFFYLTYWVWGWDTVEPISYLTALSIEAVGLYYFIKKGKGLNFAEIFTNKYQIQRKSILANNKSTNADAQLNFLKNKVDHLQSKIKFGSSLN